MSWTETSNRNDTPILAGTPDRMRLPVHFDRFYETRVPGQLLAFLMLGCLACKGRALHQLIAAAHRTWPKKDKT